jgi:hypothetical protein
MRHFNIHRSEDDTEFPSKLNGLNRKTGQKNRKESEQKAKKQFRSGKSFL